MKKICAMLLAAVMLLSACSSGTPSSSGETKNGSSQTETDKTTGTADPSAPKTTEEPQPQTDPAGSEIIIWTFSGEEERTRTVCEKYVGRPQQAVPAPEGGWKITVRTVSAEEAVSRLQAAAAADPAGETQSGEELPDIFFFRSDDFDLLKAGGFLTRVPEKGANDVAKKAEASAVSAGSSENTLYAYPAGLLAAPLLFYDRSIVADTADLASVIRQCEAAGRCFYAGEKKADLAAAVFQSCGLTYVPTVLSDGSVSRVSCTYYREGGLAAAGVIRSLMGMSGFRTTEESPVLAFSAEEDRAGAVIADSSHAAEFRGVLGDDYGISALPPITDGETSIPLCAQGSYMMIGVTPEADENRLQFCHLLALELTSSDAQRARFEANGTLPVRTSLLTPGFTADNKTASALAEQMPNVTRKTVVTGGYQEAMDRFAAQLLAGGDGMKTAKIQQLLDELSAFLMADVTKAQE